MSQTPEQDAWDAYYAAMLPVSRARDAALQAADRTYCDACNAAQTDEERGLAFDAWTAERTAAEQTYSAAQTVAWDAMRVVWRQEADGGEGAR